MNFINLEKALDGRYVLRINASLLRHGDCLRYVLYRAFYGLGRHSDMWRADYGTAVHKALEYYYGNRGLTGVDNREVALAARNLGMQTYESVFVPEDDWRTSSHLSATLNGYFKEYATDELTVELDVKGSPLLERTFEILYYEDDFCVVYLVGTVDMRATWQGVPVLVDHKTTGFWQNTSNPDKWLDTYRLSAQLMLYKWSDKSKDYQCLVNGILLKRTGTTFQRRLFEFSQEMVDENMYLVADKVGELVATLKTFASSSPASAVFARNFNHCNGTYGLCEFAPLCLANSTQHEAELITSQFEQKVYDPRRTIEEV